MNSLDLISLKKNIKDYLESTKLPWEAIRLVMKELYTEIQQEAVNEAMAQAQAEEAKQNEEKESEDETLQPCIDSEQDKETATE